MEESKIKEVFELNVRRNKIDDFLQAFECFGSEELKIRLGRFDLVADEEFSQMLYDAMKDRLQAEKDAINKQLQEL